eukprot:CAMPEP_0184742072 /NCGR_PEP_ID=MMETSP0315-20130426/5099_1 /TAXON_ID=101924 /ORGANISM="Rhodosorus marinus, Strain UTEX LB 2760" /LENGTH=298 /DNA_ID=CAMNT_0027212757 /DNA_START=214 /DNA_END=1110 /DNA_ORIENTATION=+
MKTFRLVVLSVVCIGLCGAELVTLTCDNDAEKGKFWINEACWDLVADAAPVGTICVENTRRRLGEEGSNPCFRLVYKTFGGFGLLKLRAGIWKTNETMPINSERFTRRRRIAKATEPLVQEGKIDICPGDIQVENLPCCRELLDIVAFAQVILNGTPPPSSSTTPPPSSSTTPPPSSTEPPPPPASARSARRSAADTEEALAARLQVPSVSAASGIPLPSESSSVSPTQTSTPTRAPRIVGKAWLTPHNDAANCRLRVPGNPKKDDQWICTENLTCPSTTPTASATAPPPPPPPPPQE